MFSINTSTSRQTNAGISWKCMLMENSEATKVSPLLVSLFYTHTNDTLNHNTADNLKCHFGDVGVFRGEYLILWGHGWVCRSPVSKNYTRGCGRREQGAGQVLRITRLNYSATVAQWITGYFTENWKCCGYGKTFSPLAIVSKDLCDWDRMAWCQLFRFRYWIWLSVVHPLRNYSRCHSQALTNDQHLIPNETCWWPGNS